MNNKTNILPDGSAFFTSTVMSKDEAMALPPEKRPICYRISSKMYHAVWEAIGAASTLNKDAGKEVFNNEQASNIAVDLCFKIANEVESNGRSENGSEILTCVYCGMAYPAGTPPHGSKVLSEHIKVCEKHPMRIVRKALCDLVGASEVNELIGMEKVLDIMPDTEEKAVAVLAIKALLETA